MSKILNEITTNSISISECLQRLLVIANKTDNKDLANWCLKELNGYNDSDDLPDYRKCKSRHILYTGINGLYRITNQPLQPGYLSEETLKSVEDVSLFENIIDVEKRKDLEEPVYRDLTPLAGEVYKNTCNGFSGVNCVSIHQMISQEFYTKIYIAVKTRIINLLCSFENAGIDLDSSDIELRKDRQIENDKIYNQIIVEGNTYIPEKKKKKILWNILIPTITGVVSAIVGGVLVYLITNVWMK